MDLIKISDTKLKIMLTPSDMDRYELSNSSVTFSDIHVREVLRQLLCDARVQTGFVSEDARLYVQMYPSAKGGCELFVCKLEDEGTKSSGESNALHGPGRPGLPRPYAESRALRKVERYGHDMSAYSFANLHDMICVCKRLVSIGFSGISNAYTDGKHQYFLFLCDFPSPSLYALDEYCFLNEYGTRENAKQLHTYVCEYGKQICTDNAVQTLAAL